MDPLDEAILENVSKTPGANVATILGPLRSPELSDPLLRYRLNTLSRDGFLKMVKVRTGRVLVYPIE